MAMLWHIPKVYGIRRGRLRCSFLTNKVCEDLYAWNG